MTDEQKNKILKEQLTKYLIYLGGTEDLLIENEIAFKVKGFYKCIFKFPYRENTALLRLQQDGNATPNN